MSIHEVYGLLLGPRAILSGVQGRGTGKYPDALSFMGDTDAFNGQVSCLYSGI